MHLHLMSLHTNGSITQTGFPGLIIMTPQLLETTQPHLLSLLHSFIAVLLMLFSVSMSGQYLTQGNNNGVACLAEEQSRLLTEPSAYHIQH